MEIYDDDYDLMINVNIGSVFFTSRSCVEFFQRPQEHVKASQKGLRPLGPCHLPSHDSNKAQVFLTAFWYLPPSNWHHQRRSQRVVA